MLRTVRDVSSTFPCVSLPGMNKTGAKLAGSTHPGRYTPWHEPLSRPILRTYSAEVTSPGEQSPASSQCALSQALDYCTTGVPWKSSTFLPLLQSFFTVLGLWAKGHLCNFTKRRPAAGRAAKSRELSAPVPVPARPHSSERCRQAPAPHPRRLRPEDIWPAPF